MKKSLPIVLGILFISFVIIGFIGLRSENDNPLSGALDSAQAKEIAGNKLKSSGNIDLLDVAVPKNLNSQIKDYEGFRVSFNKSNHTPNWVSWELLGTETDGSTSRYNKFWQDEEITGCPVTQDYSNSGYDRGHLCPAADQKWSESAMIDCFSLVNIAPQENALNTGAWKTLENKERIWAKRDSAIIIVAGPIYDKNDTKRIGETGVRVPGAFFKVMIAPYLPEPRGIAFVYPNMSSPGNMENYVMKIRDVEKLTGYDFFHNLPDDIEEKVETTASFRDWNRR